MADFRLPKSEIIRKKSIFQAIFSHGHSDLYYPIKILWIPASEAGAAFIVSKKTFKRAHDRNRIKRLLREGYRLHKNLLPLHNKNLAVLFIYIGKRMPLWNEINGAFERMAQEFPKKIEEL